MTAAIDGTGEVGKNRKPAGEEAKPAASPTDTDSSVPDLDKIRFDDHVVSITDPTLPKKSKVSDKRMTDTKGKGDSSPPEEIITAQTFELGRNSEELILVAPDFKREMKHKNSNKRKGRQNAKAKKKKKKRAKAKGELTPERAEEKDNFIPDDEPCIRIGDRLFSREQTTKMLQRLDEMKNEDNSARRRINNFNCIDSCRTSRAPSPRSAESAQLSKKQAKTASVPRKELSANKHTKESRPHAGAEVEPASLNVANAKTGNTLENQPRISIANQLISKEETAHFLERLDEMKDEGNSEKRRISEYNYTDSTRASALPSPGSAQRTPRHTKEVNKLPSGVEKDFNKQSLNISKEVKPYEPRPNYHRIMSCRTSKSSSPQKTKGMPRKRVRVGDHFMTVEEAQDLLQRYLKESSIRGRRKPQIQSKEPIREGSGSTKRLKVKAKNRPTAVAALEPPKGEDNDCNFSHLRSVIKTEDEVASLLLSIIVGVILLVGVCMIIGRQARK